MHFSLPNTDIRAFLGLYLVCTNNSKYFPLHCIILGYSELMSFFSSIEEIPTLSCSVSEKLLWYKCDASMAYLIMSAMLNKTAAKQCAYHNKKKLFFVIKHLTMYQTTLSVIDHKQKYGINIKYFVNQIYLSACFRIKSTYSLGNMFNSLRSVQNHIRGHSLHPSYGMEVMKTSQIKPCHKSIPNCVLFEV